MSFNCNVSEIGYPTGVYSWYHEGERIDNETQAILSVSVMDVSGFGRFSCSVSNIVDEDWSTIVLEQGCT